MFKVQIGSLLTCRDECALEFALKVDRDAGGAYLGGSGGAVMGPRHVFVAATEPTIVTLEALERNPTNPLLPGRAVLTAVPAASKTEEGKQAAAAGPSSSLNPPSWAPHPRMCDWSRRDRMKADLEEAMGIDGVSVAAYDQIKYGAGIGEDGADAAGIAKRRAAAKRVAPKRQRNSSKMIKEAEAKAKALKKGKGKGGAAKRRRGESSDDDGSSAEWSDDDDEGGLYTGGLLGLGGGDDDGSSAEGSVVEFSDGMDDSDEDEDY